VYDVATLLRAWARLPETERAAAELLVAGTGSEERALRTQAGATPVRFLGWLHEPRLDAELRAAHVYVSTSTSDSTSVSLLEAMAAGCLPVVSDIPGNREWVVDGETALLFPPGDDANLAAALQRAIREPGLRERAAERNRKVIAERATWATNMQAVEDLFARLAPGRPETS
jgi:glycosyltransferase involved in cell wall biosynthesis